MKKLGWNIHTSGMPAGDLVRLDAAVDRGSAVNLVLNDPQWAHGFKLRHPDTEVVLRLMPEWGGTDDKLRGDSWRGHADTYRRKITDLRIIAHGRNEPQPPFGDDAIQWAVNFGQECIKFGLRAVLLNASVGTLPPDQVPRLRSVIDLVNAHPGQLFLGFHAYTPPDWQKWREWLFGNFLYVIDYCDGQGIARPGMIFTEMGYDTIYDRSPGTGSWCAAEAIRVLGQPGAARNLIAAWNGTMAGLENVLGGCFYTAGGYGNEWQRFNALDQARSGFFDTLVAEWPDERAVEPEPKPEPDTGMTLCDVLRMIVERFCGASAGQAF